MKRDLPKHLYRQGALYRMLLDSGEKISLGSNRSAALLEYHLIKSSKMSDGVHFLDPGNPAVIEEMLKRHKKGARQRGLTFNINHGDVLAAIKNAGGRCAVTKQHFRNDKPHGLRFRPWMPSIDRLDSSVGYEPTNIRVVCAFVNVAMNGFGDGFFRLVLKPLIDAEVAEKIANLGFQIPQNH